MRASADASSNILSRRSSSTRAKAAVAVDGSLSAARSSRAGFATRGRGRTARRVGRRRRGELREDGAGPRPVLPSALEAPRPPVREPARARDVPIERRRAPRSAPARPAKSPLRYRSQARSHSGSNPSTASGILPRQLARQRERGVEVRRRRRRTGGGARRAARRTGGGTAGAVRLSSARIDRASSAGPRGTAASAFACPQPRENEVAAEEPRLRTRRACRRRGPARPSPRRAFGFFRASCPRASARRLRPRSPSGQSAARSCESSSTPRRASPASTRALPRRPRSAGDEAVARPPPPPSARTRASIAWSSKVGASRRRSRAALADRRRVAGRQAEPDPRDRDLRVLGRRRRGVGRRAPAPCVASRPSRRFSRSRREHARGADAEREGSLGLERPARRRERVVRPARQLERLGARAAAGTRRGRWRTRALLQRAAAASNWPRRESSAASSSAARASHAGRAAFRRTASRIASASARLPSSSRSAARANSASRSAETRDADHVGEEPRSRGGGRRRARGPRGVSPGRETGPGPGGQKPRASGRPSARIRTSSSWKKLVEERTSSGMRSSYI